MKKAILYLLALIFPFTGISQTIVSGFVNGPWTTAGSPYLVAGDVQCGNLVIQPGVDVRFQNGSGLTISGKIRAIGTATMPITFESDDTTGWSNFNVAGGGTKGILIQGQATDTSVFDHCIIRDCKGLITDIWAVGINVWASHLILKNSEIHHNYISGNMAIIRTYGCSPEIVNNIFHDNVGRGTGGISLGTGHGIVSGNEFYNNWGEKGAAIYINSTTDPTGPTISDNYIHNNRGTDGGGIFIEDGPAIISNNSIAFNNSKRGGSGMYIRNSHAKVLSNWICNNTDSNYTTTCLAYEGGGGIIVDNSMFNDTVEIYNNIIANNNSFFSGGGIRIANQGGTAFIENNHIINNTCYHGYFSGGIEITSNIHASIRNNIIWGNRAFDNSSTMDSVQVMTWANDTIALEYNCYETNSYGIATNVNTQITGNSLSNILISGVSPGFVAPTAGAGNAYNAMLADWHLLASSPCVDAGTISFLSGIPLALDIYNDPRIMGIAMDIGAVEFPSQTGIIEYDIKSIDLFPNPVLDIVYIKDESPLTNIRITDVLGNVIMDVNYAQGINVNSISPGIYFLSITGEDGMRITQIFVKE